MNLTFIFRFSAFSISLILSSEILTFAAPKVMGISPVIRHFAQAIPILRISSVVWSTKIISLPMLLSSSIVLAKELFRLGELSCDAARI